MTFYNIFMYLRLLKSDLSNPTPNVIMQILQKECKVLTFHRTCLLYIKAYHESVLDEASVLNSKFALQPCKKKYVLVIKLIPSNIKIS